MPVATAYPAEDVAESEFEDDVPSLVCCSLFVDWHLVLPYLRIRLFLLGSLYHVYYLEIV